jgi:hypothetical protein
MYSQIAATAQRIRAERDAADHLHKLRAENDQLRQQADSLGLQIAALQNRETDQRLLGLLGIVSQCAKQTAGDLRLQRCSAQLASPAVPAAASPMGNAPATVPTNGVPAPKPVLVGSTLALDGIAADAVTISRFIAALQQASIFSRVELEASTESGGGAARAFRVECHFH